MFNIFRADKTNAGDWWSPPIRYFKFKNPKALDILHCSRLPNIESIFIVGGGGLGRPFFESALSWLSRPDRKYKLISWGAGCDVLENRGGLVSASENPLGDYFSKFDINGLRVFPERTGHFWVPCSSCMWEGFDRYRAVRPIENVGLYEHKRVPISLSSLSACPRLSNDGSSIEEKVAYLARFETIVTNSYHGVYWATLLNRKVVCLPFKSGLYTFKHKPAFLLSDGVQIDELEIPSYPDALEQSREANVDFYNRLCRDFDLRG